MRLSELKGIGPKTEELFSKIGVNSVEELKEYYPVHYDSYTEPENIGDCRAGSKCAISVTVTDQVSMYKAGKLTVISLDVRDSTGKIRLVWYNSPFIRSVVKRGTSYVFRGNIVSKKGSLVMEHPEIFKPILDSNNLAIHAYGEGYVQEWEDPVRMIAFLKWDSDGIILNAYGIQPDSTMTMWLDQTDFAISLAKKLSQWREYKVVGHSEVIMDFNDDSDLINNKNNILIDFKTDLFDGTLKAVITDRVLSQLILPDHCQEIASPLPITIPCKLLPNHSSLKIDTGRINPLLYKGDHYDPFEDDMIDCHLHLEVSSVQEDKTGHIRIMGGIRGGVIYHDTTVIGKYIDKVRPEVGDLIDVPVPGKNNTE